MSNRVIKERNIFLVYLFSILTLGIYGIYWGVSTKRDINSKGGDIPHCLLAFIPLVGLYWSYKYCTSFADHIKKDNNGILYFAVMFFFVPAMPFIVQGALNEIARKPKLKPKSSVGSPGSVQKIA